jgi:hypothetical protein
LSADTFFKPEKFTAMRLFLLILLFTALFPLSVQAVQRRALIIAIDDYADPAIRPLEGAVNDGDVVQNLLREQLGFADHEIRYLKNRQASRQAILAAMDNWLVAGTEPGDKIFFYYAGHGYFLADTSGDEHDELVPRDEAICPWDTDPATLDDPRKKGNLILDDEIGARLAALKNRQSVLIFDCCHAGTLTRSLSGPDIEGVRTLNLVPGAGASRGLGKNRERVSSGAAHAWSEEINQAGSYSVFLAAASPTEQAREIFVLGRKHGALTSALVQAFATKKEATSLDDVKEEFAGIRAANPMVTQHPAIEGNPGLAQRSLRDLFLVDESAPAEDLVQAAINHNREMGLSLRINQGGNRLQVNDPLEFHVRSEQDGYLYLFDLIHSTNRMYMIYPNTWTRLAGTGNHISGKRDLRIPPKQAGGKPISFTFYADKPGRESIIGLLVSRPWAEMDRIIPEPRAGATPVNREQAEQIRNLLFSRQASRNLILAEDELLFPESDWAGTVLDLTISR